MKKFLSLCCAVLLLISMCINCAAADDLGLGSLTSLFRSEPTETFGVGEPAEVDGTVATLINVMESSGGGSNKPKSGNVFVLVEFSIKNKTKESVLLSSVMCFGCTCDDKTYIISTEALAVGMMNKKYQLDTAVEPGKTVTGVVGYEIPKNWKKLLITFSPEMMGNSVAFKVEK